MVRSRAITLLLGAILFSAGAWFVAVSRGMRNSAAVIGEVLRGSVPAVTTDDAPFAGRFHIYSSEEVGVSFMYPADYITSSFENSDGKSIVVQKPGTSEGFQVYIVPYERSPDDPLTPELIHSDIPDIPILVPREISIGGIQALSFESDHVALGRTKEIWFQKNGRLYQITGPLSAAAAIEAAVSSWEFHTRPP